MPPGTFGFRVGGHIERGDYTDHLVPGLNRAFQETGELRTLYVVDRLEHMDPSALWQDAKTGFDLGIKHHSAWKRTALVTDQDWIAQSSQLFAWMAPGEFKTFPVAELEQAKAWVAG